MSTNGDLVENPTGFSATKSINFDLEKLRQMTHSEIYVETGLGDVKSPVGHVSSCETALMCGFLKILGIELVENFCGRWKYNYTEQINNGRFKMVNDDAINLEKHLAENAPAGASAKSNPALSNQKQDASPHQMPCGVRSSISSVSVLSKKSL